MRCRIKILAGLACLLVLAIAPAAHAARGLEVAVQDDPLLVNGAHGNLTLGLNLTKRLGGSWIRANVVWSYVVDKYKRKRTAPRNIQYNWTGYDYLVGAALQQGIHVQLALTGPAPAWATGDHKVGPVEPKAGAFADFARAAAEHFRGRVTRYSIWNEPNYVGWISPLRSAPRLYRALYQRGYTAIKQADPAADVLFGETAPYALRNRAIAPLEFIRAVTCANAHYRKAGQCSTLETDGFAHHPYDFAHTPTYRYPGADNVTLGTLSRLTNALKKLRDANLLTTPSGGVPYLYLTEYGYHPSGKYKVPASKQGSYLVKAFTIAQQNRRVKQLLQYQLVNPGRGERFDTSIASSRGKPTAAFKKLATWAKRAARAGRIATRSSP
jgi:hypothetical protein